LDALLDFIIADHGQTGAIFFMMQESDMQAALKSPFVSICTDSGARAKDGPLAGSKSHPRGWGSYPRILGRYVRDEKLMPLELAIHKMTACRVECWLETERIAATGLLCRHHDF
jgi:N-acyl-D-aspartate/D-glutamate deacylase